ncbi:hypothetical protein PENSPDRAFT_653796 [Peniophora sp. CONT]|nr:hypothetical protein PENSPDRAFT_653796 [Peniophora sp. CONT]
MSLSSLNGTQIAEVLDAVFKSTALIAAPLLLLESFMMGVLWACVPLGSYLLWVKSHSFSRAPFIFALWVALMVFFIHWILSLKQLESTLTGRSLGISLTMNDVYHATHPASFTAGSDDKLDDSYIDYGEAWEYLLPLITETMLFGFASSLFAISAYTSIRQYRLKRHSSFGSIIHIMTSLMYTLSLVHWAVYLRYFSISANQAASGDPIVASYPVYTAATVKVTLLTLLSINTLMSDSIVLWRMYIVWNKAFVALALGAALLVTSLGLSFVNILGVAGIQFGTYNTTDFGPVNADDSEDLPTYGVLSVGIAAAFMSLAINLCATILVGLVRVWLYRRQISKHFRSSNRRTFAERVMELLVDSGVAYAAIWLLYCISIYRPITRRVVLGQKSSAKSPVVTATSHLDAAMAQITSIYPLIIFILVNLNKVHYTRGPRVLLDDEVPTDKDLAVTITFEIDVERSTIQGGRKGLNDEE